MKRAIRRLYIKLVRAEGSPESIARGVAIGLATGLIIPIGFQTLPALALAFLLKANKVLSWTFTCVTNPATVFVIYPFQCWLGSILIFHPLSIQTFSSRFSTLANAKTYAEGFHALASLGLDVLIPFFAGGLFFAIVSVPIGYWVSLRLVQAYQRRKAQLLLLRRQKKEAEKKSRMAGEM